MLARFITLLQGNEEAGAAPDGIAAEDLDLLFRAVTTRLTTLADEIAGDWRPAARGATALASDMHECIDALQRLRLSMHREIERLRGAAHHRADATGTPPP